MKKISVKNFKGEEFEGMWNEKTRRRNKEKEKILRNWKKSKH